MYVLLWLLMMMGFKVTSLITKGRLRCNWLTAGIAATLHLAVFCLPFYYLYLHQKALGFGPHLTSTGLLIFFVLLVSFPVWTCVTIILCSKLLPGFSLHPQNICESDYLKITKLFKTYNQEIPKKILDQISKKPTFKKYMQEIIVCTAIFDGVLMASNILTPFFSPIVMLMILSFAHTKAMPRRNRLRGEYDPWLDIYNPNNHYNWVNPHSPYHRK